ncbi:50S ribosomal protein L31 [Pandoraea captiosa]|uniref:50S ribosomal protein L31 n=2 Tax=Pandoraea TaxID=93217 RepID=A0A5E4ZH90_9BURK|nr:50S ribosomal protein L31 [Pandoraea captiosa]
MALAGKGLAQTGYRLNSRSIMKEGIHPNYREVVFKDMTPGIDFQFISRSTIQTKETIEVDGKEYPLVKLDTSSASHNFYTGETRIMDAEGRVDKFKKKFGARAGGKVA